MRAHANNWTPEHQRAFIAALATTGNVKPAARAVGRYPNGAERLRKHPRGKSFAEAWDDALDLYREREHALLRESLVELDAKHREALEEKRHVAAEMDYEREVEIEGAGEDFGPDEVAELMDRIKAKLDASRSFVLFAIAEDPAKRAASETLCGPVDWTAIGRGEVEVTKGFPNMKEAEWAVTNEHVPLLEGVEVREDEEADKALARVATQIASKSPFQIEAEQAKGQLGEPSVRDCREMSVEELRARGFNRTGDAWIKRL